MGNSKNCKSRPVIHAPYSGRRPPTSTTNTTTRLPAPAPAGAAAVVVKTRILDAKVKIVDVLRQRSRRHVGEAAEERTAEESNEGQAEKCDWLCLK